MNKNIIKGLVALFAAGSLASCSSDYLDVAPETTVTEAIATEKIDGVEAALRGVYNAMYAQYSSWSGSGNYRGFNGAAWCDMFYGDVPGQDAYYLVWASDIFIPYIVNGDGMTNDQYWFCQPGWVVYYTIINEANNILYGIDRCQDATPEQIDNVVAQCKAMRAFAYTKLLEIYAPRWEDSNNGEALCLVKRIADKNYGGSPLVSMNEIFELIYQDLDDALALFAKTGYQRSETFRVDANIAKGFYARAAMIKHDYAKAQTMAGEARKGITIMSGKEYNEGFAYANHEWMWYLQPNPEDIYYCAPYAFYGCNGAYIEAWVDFGAGAINYDLYRKMDPNDSRRALFWTPDKINKEDVGEDNTILPEDYWWNSNKKRTIVNPQTMDMANNNVTVKQLIDVYANSPKLAGYNNPSWPGAYAFNTTKPGATNICVPFGAQFKFWAFSPYGTSHVLFMRAAELLLTEAEAAYYNGDMATAKANLEELNSKRVPGYTCTKSGAELLDEIRLSRRLELWGEGHSWFDLKRWNLPIVRRAWVQGDPTSNNIPAPGAVTIDPSAHNGWVFALPRAEWLYNDAVENPNAVSDSPQGQQKPALRK